MPNLKNYLLLTVILCSLASCNTGIAATPEITATSLSIVTNKDLTPTPDNAPTNSPVATLTADPTSTGKVLKTQLKPGQYILYHEYNNAETSKAKISALSPYTGERYPLYDINYDSVVELSSDLNYLAVLTSGRVELTDLNHGISKTILFIDVCDSAAWSPDEKKIAVTCGDVFVINFSDSSILQVTDYSDKYGSSSQDVSWSPDGNQIAYNNSADPYGKDPYDGIYIMDATCLQNIATCKEQTKFFEGPFYDFNSSKWSSDSARLAFLAFGNIFTLDIGTMKLNSYIALPQELPTDNTGLTWSYDGNQFAVSNETEQKIKVISAKNGAEIASFPVDGYVISWIKVPWRFAKGDVYKITTIGDNLNLRREPTIQGKILTKLGSGEEITILEGPVDEGGYTWWKIKANNDTEGWIVDIPEWISPVK